MTIVLKEAARRRITRRRKVESNGKPREYSQAAAPKSVTPMAEFLAGVADLRARVLAKDAGAFDGISGADLVNAGRAHRIAGMMGDYAD